MDNLIFTKLNTVKCDKFELTYSDFYVKMAKFITQNPNIYNIHYNDENELYEATYNSDKYVVKYGKEILNKKSENKNILSLLNDLEKISNKQLSLNETMEKEQELEKENRERVIENGKKGI